MKWCLTVPGRVCMNPFFFCYDPFFLKVFPHDLYYEFIDSMNLKECIRDWLRHPVRKKCFVSILNQWIHNTNDEGIVLEKKVHENFFRNCETLLQWVWRYYFDYFMNARHFFLTGYVNWCLIYHFKSIESMNS